jgi:hypothetical protein
MNKIPWIAFVLALLLAIFYFSNSASSLPPMVASHFDGAGFPTAHMTRASYTKFVFAMGVGFPIAMVALLTLVYSIMGIALGWVIALLRAFRLPRSSLEPSAKSPSG